MVYSVLSVVKSVKSVVLISCLISLFSDLISLISGLISLISDLISVIGDLISLISGQRSAVSVIGQCHLLMKKRRILGNFALQEMTDASKNDNFLLTEKKAYTFFELLKSTQKSNVSCLIGNKKNIFG